MIIFYVNYLNIYKKTTTSKLDKKEIFFKFSFFFHSLFSRLLINVPLITDNALVILKRYCQDEIRTKFGMNILNNLLIHRIPIREKCLDILFYLIQIKNNSLKNNVINILKHLYQKNQFKQLIKVKFYF